MPAKDLFHDCVRHALIHDGWTITHDPLRLNWGGKDLYVDLGAEQLMAAEKSGQRIAVEVKSFVGTRKSTTSKRQWVSTCFIGQSWRNANPRGYFFSPCPNSSSARFLIGRWAS